MIRVLLADDQALVRAGFRALLDAQEDLEVVGSNPRSGNFDNVRAVAAGDALLSPGVTRRLIATFARNAKEPGPAAHLDVLTDREREVVALVGEGLSNDEIAQRLFMSPATAKTHVNRSMTKLGARDRAQLVVVAYESGLVRPGWL